MHESLQLFKELCNTKWFAATAFILFLNKRDIFEEKIRRVPLTVCFPEYNGIFPILFFFFLSLIFFAGPQTYEDCSVYIKEKFMSLNENREKPIYAHFTCATDTENIIVVFNAVRDIILSKTLKVIGMPI